MDDASDRSVLECSAAPLCLELVSLSLEPPQAQAETQAIEDAVMKGGVRGQSKRRKGAQGQKAGAGAAKRAGGAPSATAQAVVKLQAQRLHILRRIAPGSPAEVELGAKHVQSAVSVFGEGSQEAADARRLCNAAHVARYGGNLSEGVMQKLVAAQTENDLVEQLTANISAVLKM